MSNLYDLEGKRVLITGAAGLLGRAHVEALASTGAVLDLWDKDFEKLIQLKQNFESRFVDLDISVQKIDITEEDQIANIVGENSRNGICIDVLINNAAINPAMSNSNSKSIETSRLENFPLDSWNKEISVGLTGAFLCSKHIGGKMAIAGKGVIINIASDLSVIAPDQRIYRVDGLSEDLQPMKPVTYSVIKSGLIGLTKYLATYWAASGIRVNALSPGGIFDNHSDDFVKKLTNLIPMGRMANPEDYFGAVQFLCSDASSYMTGQNLVVDGGRSIW